MKEGNFPLLYKEIASSERDTRALLTKFEKDHPGQVTKTNFTDITKTIFKKSSRAAILEELSQKPSENKPD